MADADSGGTRAGGSPRRNATPAPRVPGAPDVRSARSAKLRRALVGTTVRGRTIDIVQAADLPRRRRAARFRSTAPTSNGSTARARRHPEARARFRAWCGPTRTSPRPAGSRHQDRSPQGRAIRLLDGRHRHAIATATTGTIASYYQVNGMQYPIYVEAPPSSVKRSRRSLNCRSSRSQRRHDRPQRACRARRAADIGPVATAGTPVRAAMRPARRRNRSRAFRS